jgi:lambda family phage portal protein
MNIIDSIIEVFSPRVAAKRAAARTAIGLLRGYDGASKGTRRTDSWRTAGTSANSETRRGLLLLRDRARDLVRNNPYSKRAVDVIAANVVGYGIKTNIKTRNKKTNKPLQDAYTAWAESTDCDAEGRHDIYGLQEIAARAIVESGEVVVRRVWVKRKNPRDIPLALQVLEGDFIDSARTDVLSNGNEIVQGVEYQGGRRVALWMFDKHPGDGYSLSTGSLVSKRTPIEDVLHVFRTERPGQARGVTWFAPVVIRMRDQAEYEDAQLIRQKIAACFAMFISDMEGSGAEQTGADSVAEMVERLEPGIIQRMPPGTTPSFATPPSVQGYREYMSVSLHAVAVGVGVPYEALTGDYSQVNFTSGRMGFGQFHALVDVWQWKTFIPQFCGGVFNWFKEAATLAGLQTEGATARYVPPHKALVDPTREIPAIIKAVRGGLLTLSQAIREMGYEPEEFLAECADTNAALDKLGLIFDSDPRRVTNGGQAQAAETAPGDGTETAGEGADDDTSKAAA